jgi:hypothetical protein
VRYFIVNNARVRLPEGIGHFAIGVHLARGPARAVESQPEILRWTDPRSLATRAIARSASDPSREAPILIGQTACDGSGDGLDD